MVITHLQIVGSFSVNLTVPWPESFVVFLEPVSLLQLDAFHDVGLGCMPGVREGTFLHAFAVSVVAPVAVVILNFAVMAARMAITRDAAVNTRVRMTHMKLSSPSPSPSGADDAHEAVSVLPLRHLPRPF